MPETKRQAEQGASEVPLYTLADAVRYLRVPFWFVLPLSSRPPYRIWEFGERFWHDRFRFRTTDDFGPAFRDGEPVRLSFRSLAALFVTVAVYRFASARHSNWWHPEELNGLIEALVDTARRGTDAAFLTDPEAVAARYNHLFDLGTHPSRERLLKVIALNQSRVELDEGWPVRLFPFARDPAPDAPRAVVLDPEFRFGRPTVNGVPTDVLAERWRAGDRVADLAEDYDLATEAVEEALRYEATPNDQSPIVPFPPFGW